MSSSWSAAHPPSPPPSPNRSWPPTPTSSGRHRLAIAAHLQGRDRTGTAAAVGRLTRVLDELDAHPDPATQILLRNAAQWLGPVDLTTDVDEPASHLTSGP